MATFWDASALVNRWLAAPSVSSGAGIVGAKGMHFTGDLSGGTVGGGYAMALPSAPEMVFPGDFTWEGYLQFDAAAGASERNVFFSIGSGWAMVRRSGVLVFGLSGVSNYIVGAGTLANGVVYEWSVTRSGTTLTLRLNGAIQGTSTRSESVPSNTFVLGGGLSGSGSPGGSSASPFRGVLGPVRITKAARYATGASYTPDFLAYPEGAADPYWADTVALVTGDANYFAGAAAIARPASSQAHPTSWPIRTVSLTPPPPVYRYYWGGLGKIVGTTKIKGTPNTPVSRRVRLIREVDAVCVGERWSDPATGAYEFVGFDPTVLYSVIVYDGPRVFRAAIQDAVVPEVYTL